MPGDARANFKPAGCKAPTKPLPRPSDPANTALALQRTAARRRARHRELSRAGHDLPRRLGSAVGQLVLRVGCRIDVRPAAWRRATFRRRSFGDEIRRYGSLLARTHVVADAAIVWPPTLFPASLTNGDFRRVCRLRRSQCSAPAARAGLPARWLTLSMARHGRPGDCRFFCRRCHRRSQQVE